MGRVMQCVHLVVLTVFGVFVPTGQAEEPCDLRLFSSDMFVSLGEWVLLNCTFTCPNMPNWKSRLQKNNSRQGPNWTSVEVLVDDWEKSKVFCMQSFDDGRLLDPNVTLMAYARPSKVMIDLEAQEMEEGKTYIVNCSVYDVAPVENLQIQLLRGDTVLYKSTFTDDKPRGKQTVKEIYYITASRMDNLQNFSCLATLVTTRNFTVNSSTVILRTYGPPDVPVVTISPETNIQEEDSFTITCLSDGSPRPEYHWIVPPGAEVSYTWNNSAVLVMTAAPIHSGNYTCEAKNKHGTVSASQNVQITPQTKGQSRNWIGSIISAVLVFIMSFVIYHKTKSSD